jgi:hypothetical protein
MKNSNQNLNTAKELQDAMMAFGNSITRAMIEAQTKTWEEMMRFSEITTKIAVDASKEVPFMKGFPNFLNK